MEEIIKEQKEQQVPINDKGTGQHSWWGRLALSCCAATHKYEYKILVYVYMKAGADHAIEDISRRLRVNCHTHYNVSE